MVNPKSIVYVVQDSPGKNLNDAHRFGKIRILLFPRDVRRGPDFMVSKLVEELQGITSIDYVLLIGDPVAIGLTLVLSLDILGTVVALKWNRREYKYEPMEITV